MLRSSIKASSIRIRWQHIDVDMESRYLLCIRTCIFPKWSKSGLFNISTKGELLKSGSEKMSIKKY